MRQASRIFNIMGGLIDAGTHTNVEEGAHSGFSLLNLSPTIMGTAGLSMSIMMIMACTTCCLVACCLAAARKAYAGLSATAERRATRTSQLNNAMGALQSIVSQVPRQTNQAQTIPMISPPPQLIIQ